MKKLLCLALAALLMLTGCSSKPSSSDSDLYNAGTYTASAKGNNGDVTVEVVFTSDAIQTVTVKEHSETAGLSDPAIERIPTAIVENQSLAIETVSGATNTSNAILNAVADAVEQAGGDVAALKNAQVDDDVVKNEVEKEIDVVVVGSGISGLATAISAAENGANVVVLEKMATTGGTTAISGGYLICVESETYANSEKDDSLETFRAFWNERMAYSGAESGYPDEARWELVMPKTGETVDWLVTNGVSFNEDLTNLFGNFPVANNPGGGRQLIDEMIVTAESLGVEVITECKATSLVLDNGAVVGVVAESADEIITYHTSAVVLATGGISANEELVEQYSPKVSAAGTISTAAAGCTGDGFLMALDAGAVAFDNFFTSIASTTVDPEFASAVAEASSLTTVAQLGVNSKAERFASESPAYFGDALGSDMIQDGNAPFWYIYDSSNADITAILENGVAANVVAKGETIAELAAAMGVDADALQATYDAYAECVASGVDSQYAKPSDYLVSLETAPYYAVKFYPTTFGSQGGVLTDEGGRCLNANNEVIVGLYATGADSNRYYYNENYVLAASLGIYATTGRLTGEAVAVDIAK